MYKGACSLLITTVLMTTLFIGCGKESNLLQLASNTSSPTSSYSGNIIVSNQTLLTVVMYDPTGQLIQIMRDLNSTSETPYGLAPFTSGMFLITVDGTDRVETVNLTTLGVSSIVTDSNLSSNPVQGLAVDSSYNIYVVESSTNDIEKFTSAGIRSGAPFIDTVVGACTLSTPRHIAIAANGNIAVTNTGNNRLNIYNSAGSSCVASVKAAPFGSNAPYGLAYDSVHDKFIVAFNTNGAIVSISTTGTGASTIYTDVTTLATPTAVAVDSSGNLLVTSQTFNTIEKLTFNGVTATRSGSSPFIRANTYIRGPSGIMVVP